MASPATLGTVHIVGAGLAGLSCAVALARRGANVMVHEAARFAGGRCRSYFEPALGATIDNGNHLVLSGNRATIAYVKSIGAADNLVGPETATFAFADLKSGERWKLRINEGRVPWWILSRARRVPETRVRDYLAVARLLRAEPGDTVASLIGSGALYHRLWRPVLLAALNTDPCEASGRLAGTVVQETLAKGGKACRPLIAGDGLAAAFVDPALVFLKRHSIPVRFDHRLRALDLGAARVDGLQFAGGDRIALGCKDRVVLAVPAPDARVLLPGCVAPTKFRAIINAHFKVKPPPGTPPMLGVINAMTEWMFAFQERLSITISAADRLIETPRVELARNIWREVASLTGLPRDSPAWQIIKERRATIAALPSEESKRPGARTQWSNLVLAGDWTATGLPATIEGAIRSGNRAAELILAG
ncbi:MAG TPA: hydroxysqualene dehydroxylase HpnE [Hyphomicrobiaceae bacterium]|nr:hydroxysqualene dehydroxylase HpnE [Hyphomicrobiaceae bacterium]